MKQTESLKKKLQTINPFKKLDTYKYRPDLAPGAAPKPARPLAPKKKAPKAPKQPKRRTKLVIGDPSGGGRSGMTLR
jgi:hypothetical protein